MSRVVLLTGLQGSGKTTLGDALALDWGCGVLSWDLVASDMLYTGAAGREEVWAVLLSQTRDRLLIGEDVVVEGMAKATEVHAFRKLCVEMRAQVQVVLLSIENENVHKRRLQGRIRDIPGLGEVSWERALRARNVWQVPKDVDTEIDESVELDAAVKIVNGFWQ